MAAYQICMCQDVKSCADVDSQRKSPDNRPTVHPPRMQLQCERPNNSQCSQSSVVPDLASCCLVDFPPKNAILRPLHKNVAVEFKWEKGFLFLKSYFR